MSPAKHHPFGYQAEKFSQARRALMIPFTQGEAQSIADAFHFCSRGLMDLKREELEENPRDWIAKVERSMDPRGLQDPHGLGTAFIKASSMTDDEKREFANAVDELAQYFHREFWSAE